MSPTSLEMPADNRVLFFDRDSARFGFLSSFHPAPISLDGETWPTVEHYYQCQKSTDPEYRRAIREAGTPGKAKRLAAPPDGPPRLSRHSWFQKHGAQPRADWHEVKLDVMRQAVRAKFTQNTDLAMLLLATGSAELVEDSPSEPYWGTGRDGRGLNWLGRLLMEVREEVRRGAGLTGGTPAGLP